MILGLIAISLIVLLFIFPLTTVVWLAILAILMVVIFSTFLRLFFIVGVLPFYMFQDGLEKFKKYMNKHNAWWQIPYMLLAALAVLLILLLANGYTW